MRIERVHLDGFGRYADQEIGPFDDALTVVAGENEAGKSTLLAFVRAVLFGFPQRLGGQHYPPLRGGNHGGRVTLRLADGQSYVAQRHQGRGRGLFEARGGSGDVLDEPAFGARIGHASEALFLKAFTFNLDDLAAFGDGAEDRDLGGLLYGASMGAERLPVAQTRIENRAGEIFRERGSAQIVAGLIRDLDETEAKLREVAGQAVEYRQLIERREQIQRDLVQLSERSQEAARTYQELDRRLRAWDDWTLLRALDQQLAGMDDTSGFPADGVARLDRAERDLRDAETARTEAAEELAAARREAERDIPDSALLDAATQVEALRRDRGAADDSLRDLPERQAELRSRTDDLTRRLGELGPGWDEARLFALDLSIPRRDEIDGWSRRLEQARAEQRDRERDRNEAQRALDEAAASLREAEDARDRLADAPDEATISDRAARVRALRTAHDAYERARAQAADRAAHAAQLRQAASRVPALTVAAPGTPSGTPSVGPGAPIAALVAALVAALGAAFGWIVAEGAGALGGAVAGAIAGAIIGYVLRARPSPTNPVAASVSSTDPQVELAARMAEEAQEHLDAAAVALRSAAAGVVDTPTLDGQPDAALIEAAEAALERDRPRAAARTRAIDAASNAAAAHVRAQRRLEQETQAHHTATVALEDASTAWRQWLVAVGLSESLTPQTATALLASADAARARAEEVREYRHRVEAIQHDIDEYRARVESLAGLAGIDTSFADDRAAVAAADTVIARFEAARDAQALRRQALAAVEAHERAHQRAEAQSVEAQSLLDALLMSGGVDTPEAFRQRAQLAEDRRALEGQRAACELSLLQVVGTGEGALEALDSALGETTREELESMLETARIDRDETQSQRDALLAEGGEVRGKIERLHDDESASEIRARAAMLREQLQEQARTWSSLIVARSLLQRVREQYERERQPAVIQHAEQFFRTLTGGRYVRLFQPIGEKTFTVVASDGSTRTPEQLSRGTKEQLYLALRLGAIQEAVKNSEPLPVIVDEVMVNFDETRARRAVEAFVQLSQHTQVIVFTCHPWIQRLFEEVVSSASATGAVAVIDGGRALHTISLDR